MPKTTLNPSPGTFPLPEMITCGLWAALSPGARAVLGVLWDHHRRYPDACHPSQGTQARASGVSKPTVARAIIELEKVGLVRVIPSPGPGPNTYRLNWIDLNLPGDKPETVPDKPTPYQRPNPAFAMFLDHGNDADGDADNDDDKDDQPTYHRKHYGHCLPDGCMVHTAREVVVHDWLVAAGVPHWCQVPYAALHIRGLHEKSSVDFVAGPRLVIEVFGMPPTQKRASTYTETRRKKEKAIAAAGWILLAVEPDKQPDEHLVQAIIKHWALTTVQQASDLHDLLERAGLWLPANPSCHRMSECLSDARDRAARHVPARRRPSVGSSAWTPAAGVADLLLDESAGSRSTEYYDDFLADLLDGPTSDSKKDASAISQATARMMAIDEKIAAIKIVDFDGNPNAGPDYYNKIYSLQALKAEREKLVKESGLGW